MSGRLSSLWYNSPSGSADLLLASGLAPFSGAYGTVLSLRRRAYRAGCLRTRRLPFPVVSVGNLTVGGTGKTPLVMFLARMLSGMDRMPGIVTRGYGGRCEPGTVVSDGKSILHDDPDLTGDEPLLLARELPGIPVIIHPDRYTGGRIARERCGCDCILLDDGYQHMALARDLNILVMDATAPLGNGRVLPAGPLREPASAARDADLFIFTKINQTADQSAMHDIIARFPPVPYAACGYTAGPLTRLRDGTPVPSQSLHDKTVHTVTGLARPGSFIASVASQDITVTDNHIFPDHHRFTEKDITSILHGMHNDGCLITSAKDAVRLPAGLRQDPRFCVLELQLDFGDTLPAVREKLSALFDSGERVKSEK